jgi:hypothetical protein
MKLIAQIALGVTLGGVVLFFGSAFVSGVLRGVDCVQQYGAKGCVQVLEAQERYRSPYHTR